MCTAELCADIRLTLASFTFLGAPPGDFLLLPRFTEFGLYFLALEPAPFGAGDSERAAPSVCDAASFPRDTVRNKGLLDCGFEEDGAISAL